MKNAPKVFDYTDYRRFLNDYVAYRKEASRNWTVPKWQKDLDLKTLSNLTMVLKEQRHASAKMVEAFCRYFRFSLKEEKYFKELVHLQKFLKNEPLLTVFLHEKFSEQQSIMVKEGQSARSEDAIKAPSDLFFNWAVYTLREITQLKDFQEDPAWIAQRLDVPLKKEEIAQLLQRMLESGLIEKSESGFSLVGQMRPSEAVPPKEDIRKYHEGLMALSSQAFDQPLDRRTFCASTLCVSQEKLPEAHQLIREFQSRFSRLIEETPGDEVYQLNMQFFPLTKQL